MNSFLPKIIPILLLLVIAGPSFSQNIEKDNIENCELKLSKAQALFESGKLEKIPALLRSCTLNKGLSKPVRFSIIKLLTESYLFLGENELAEEFYATLLKIDPFYKPRFNVDHPELVYLGNKFSTLPTFSFGIKAGVNSTFTQSNDNFVFQDTVASISENYENAISYHFGGFISQYLKNSNFEVSAGVLYTSIKYSYNAQIITDAVGESADLIFDESYTSLSIPLILKYNFGDYLGNKQQLSTYAYLGASFDFNLSARIDDIDLRVIKDNMVGGAGAGGGTGFDLMDGTEPPTRIKTNYSVMAGLGIKYKIKTSHLFLELSYRNTLQNIVKTENRFNNKIATEFWHVDNNLKWHSIYLSLGYSYSFYKVRKR